MLVYEIMEKLSQMPSGAKVKFCKKGKNDNHAIVDVQGNPDNKDEFVFIFGIQDGSEK